jgi:hypothetical protein
MVAEHRPTSSGTGAMSSDDVLVATCRHWLVRPQPRPVVHGPGRRRTHHLERRLQRPHRRVRRHRPPHLDRHAPHRHRQRRHRHHRRHHDRSNAMSVEAGARRRNRVLDGQTAARGPTFDRRERCARSVSPIPRRWSSGEAARSPVRRGLLRSSLGRGIGWHSRTSRLCT